LRSGSNCVRSRHGTTVRELLELPLTYDVVVSDFGREAALNYLRAVSIKEREIISAVLNQEGRPFFDEYRHIMFSVVADIAYLKKQAIAHCVAENAYLTEDVLIGVGPSPMPGDLVDRAAAIVAQAASAAVERGYDRIRVVAPCNRLADLTRDVVEVLESDHELKRIARAHRLRAFCTFESVELTAHTAPDAVMHKIVEAQSERVLVLGTADVREIYRRAIPPDYRVELATIDPSEQALIEETVVASIGGVTRRIDECRRRIWERLIAPRQAQEGGFAVVEACTDFSLGLGLNSLEALAEAMAADAYRAVMV
jgi:hypothetical protein